ncbi:hypothetical protein E4U40_000659 [Claviceps sp. LM458 group G5]|nr:hypothetical protein E4U40_000659 [Claviceps sp. LM458 group G5]
MSDSPEQSRQVNDEQFDAEHLLWTNMLSGESSEYARQSYATVCSALHPFCEAFERREARVEKEKVAAAARRGDLPPGEPHNTALQPSHGHDAALHTIGPKNDTSNDDKVVTADTMTLDRFWSLLLDYWQRREGIWDPTTTFDKLREVLQRRKEMAKAGIVALDFLLEMLMGEFGAQHAYLFPTMLTPEQWCQLLADFSREDCKILFLLDLDSSRKTHRQAS